MIPHDRVIDHVDNISFNNHISKLHLVTRYENALRAHNAIQSEQWLHEFDDGIRSVVQAPTTNTLTQWRPVGVIPGPSGISIQWNNLIKDRSFHMQNIDGILTKSVVTLHGVYGIMNGQCKCKWDCCLFLLSSTQQKRDAKRVRRVNCDRRVKRHKRAIRKESLQREGAKEESEDPLRLWSTTEANVNGYCY